MDTRLTSAHVAPARPTGSHLAQPDASPRGALLLDVAAHIRSHDYAVVSLGSEECTGSVSGDPGDEQWSYTIGLTEQGLPELVVLGLAPAPAGQLVRWGIELLAGAGARPVGTAVWVGPTPLVVQQVPAEWLACDPGRMGLWMEHYGVGRRSLELPEVAEVVWGDQHGRFPDHGLCDPYVAEGQPVLAADPFSFPAPVQHASHRGVRRQFRRR